MRARPLLGGMALLAIGVQGIGAQETTVVQPAPQVQTARRTVPVFGISVGSMSIESGSAATSQVGERSYGLQLDAGALVARHFYFGMDVGGQFLDDHAQFTQNTTGGEMKSTANVTYVSAIIGGRTGALGPMALGLNLGASASFSRRSIDNCSDCSVDKLSIPGGAFVEPMAVFGRGNARLRMTDRVYLAGNGMRNVMSMGAELLLQKR